MTRFREGAAGRGRRSAALVLVLLGSAIDRAPAQIAEAPSPPAPVEATPAPRPAPRPAHGLNPLSALDPASLDGFKGRPLFAPSRRPPPPRQIVVAPPPPVAVASLPPDLRLVGVVAGSDRAVAILRRPAGGPSLNVKVGDTVDAWRVDAIGPDRVTLRDGERDRTYRLFGVGGPSGPPPAARITNLPQIGIPAPQ